QSAGIEQVNQTVTQMDEATQQNAALVEEATAAARSMEEQAGQLGEAVAQFRTASTDPARLVADLLHARTSNREASPRRETRPPAPPSRQPVAESDWQTF
ncbi:hypothetical protein HH297_05880, partial [Xanthomonas sp. Kuri4-3]